MPIDTTCTACGAHLRVPRKLINAGDPIPCVKCGSPIDVLRVAAQVAAGVDEPVATTIVAETESAPCEFCDVQLRRFQFLQEAVKVCPRCGKRLVPEEPAPTPARAAPYPIDDDASSDTIALSDSEVIETPTVTPVAAPTADEEPEQPSWLARLDIATVLGFVCTGVALLLASLPGMSLLSRVLAGIGLLAGATGAVVAHRQLRSLLAPVAVCLLGALGLFVAGGADPGQGRPLPPPMPEQAGPMHAPPGTLPGQKPNVASPLPGPKK